MSLTDCIKTLRDAHQISQDEAERLVARYQELESLGYDNGAIKEAISTELRGTKLHEKRITLLQRAADEDLANDVFAYRDERGRQDPAKAFFYLMESFGEGKAKDVVHARDIIQREAMRMMQKPLWEFRKGAITGDKRRTGKYVGNAKVKAQLENVIRELGGENTDDQMAGVFAQSWKDTSEYLRQRFNAAGGDIGKLDDWIMSQWHDPQALLDASREKWVGYMTREGVLNRDKMVHPLSNTKMTDAELKSSLEYIWQQITSDGWFGKAESDARPGGKGALYKRRADHRFLHFKDADAWLTYQKDFGGGDPYAAMIGHISSMSRDIAAMERFGPNPEMGLQRVKDKIIRDAATARTTRSIMGELKEKLADISEQMKSVKAERMAKTKQRIDAMSSKMETMRSEIAHLERRHNRLSKRNKRKRARLEKERLDLTAEWQGLSEDLRLELIRDNSTLTPQDMATTDRLLNEFGQTMEEMQGLDVYAIDTPNPHARAKQILHRADQLWKNYSGLTNTPINSRAAGGMVVVRNWVSASILVRASISSVADNATAIMRRDFIGMPSVQQLTSFARSFGQEERKLALNLSLGLDQAANAFQSQARYLNTVNVRDFSGYIVDRTHAMSFLSPMTQAQKVAFATDFQSWMADLRTTPFEELPQPTRRMFDRHGFTQDDWGVLQGVEPQVEMGREFMSPEAIRSGGGGRDLSEKYLMMLLREQRKAVIEGTSRSRTLWVSETQPGTIVGEALRSVSMLKSFPTTYATLILGDLYREIMAGNNQSAARYAAGLILIGSIFGALAKQIKSVTQGRDPEPMDTANFWYKAFMQSGGAGIYGDFLGSGVNRFGSGFATTAAGPLASRMGTVRDLTLGNFVQYANEDKTNLGREAVQMAREMTPGAFAPFYIRTLYERAILDELQKMVDPKATKSFRQKRRRSKKMYGNDQWWPQGAPLPERAPDFGTAIGSK